MKRIKNSIAILIALQLILTLAASSVSAKGDDNRVRVTSDRLEADDMNGRVIFKGNVVARHKDAVITSQMLTVTYGKDREMEKANARNKVKINEKNRVGTCENADFFPKQKKIVMTGEPRVWRDGNIVEGEKITIYLESDRMDVEGAKAVIQSKETKTVEEGSDSAADKK